MPMSCAYHEMYLYDACRNLGELTEYAYEACHTPIDRALHYFVVSGYAARFEDGDPAVVSGLSGTELYCRSADACGDSMEKWPDALIRYDTDADYWIGYILAYFQWANSLSFQNIITVFTADDLLRMYPALHTASEEKAADTLLGLYRNRRSACLRLQEYRKRLGMTQAELARASGVNLRTLQQYESGAKRINKAAAESVIALADVLRCHPSDLMAK